jgi:hypothetical protein
LRKYMKLAVALAALTGIFVLACSNAAPVEPTPNIDATVEAKLAQERSVDATAEAKLAQERSVDATVEAKLAQERSVDATVEAKAKELIAAQTTNTPVPTQSPKPSPEPSLVNIPSDMTVDSVIARIVDPTVMGGGFGTYEGPSDTRGSKWERGDEMAAASGLKNAWVSTGTSSNDQLTDDEYRYTVAEFSLGGVLASLLGPTNFVPDDFFERGVLLLGAVGFTEKASRSLIEQMRFKVESARTDEMVEECVGDLTVSVSPFSFSDAGVLDAGMIVVAQIPCESAPIISNNQVVAQWTGNSIKDTETFDVSTNEWKISWDTRPGDYGEMNFQIYVYKSDGTPHGTFVVANVIGRDTDSSVMRGAGSFYLTINSGQPYEVTVEEMP